MAIKRETLDKPVYIYRLSDPETDEIRYIGQTSMPTIRLGGHVRDAKNKAISKPMKVWITGLVQRDLLPVMEIIEEVDSSVADTREEFWINWYRQHGANLCNSRFKFSYWRSGQAKSAR